MISMSTNRTASVLAVVVVVSAGSLPLGASQLLAQTQGVTSRQDEAYLVLPRLTGPVVLDGVSDEPAWQAVEPFPLTMYTPTAGGALTERTEIRVAYDEGYLYVAGRFFDSDPAGIQVNSMYRDRLSGDDCFGIVVDPFNDNDIGLWFWTTPAWFCFQYRNS